MINGIKDSGGISFGVSMSTAGLKKSVTAARKMLGGFVADIQKQFGNFRGMLNGIGGQITAAFSVAGLAAFAKNQFDVIDALDETSKRLNVSTEALSAYGYAATMSGSSQEEFQSGLQRMIKSTGDAAKGLGAATKVYETLGLNAKSLNTLKPDEQFLKISDAIAGMANENDKLNATMAIFGKGAAGLLETLKLGTSGLDAMKQEAQGLGIVINGMDAAKIAEAADELERVKKMLSGIMNEAVIEWGPGVTNTVANIATGFSRMTGGSAGQNRAEKALAAKTDAWVARQEAIQAEVRAKYERKQLNQRLNNMWETTFKNTRSRQSGAMFDFIGGKANDAISIGKNLLSAPADILSGIINSPIAQMQRQLFMANIKAGKVPGAQQPGATTTTSGGFNALQSGSVAAYQQRVRGAQQFDKVEVQQLNVQKQSMQHLATIAQKMPEFEAVG